MAHQYLTNIGDSQVYPKLSISGQQLTLEISNAIRNDIRPVLSAGFIWVSHGRPYKSAELALTHFLPDLVAFVTSMYWKLAEPLRRHPSAQKKKKKEISIVLNSLDKLLLPCRHPAWIYTLYCIDRTELIRKFNGKIKAHSSKSNLKKYFRTSENWWSQIAPSNRNQCRMGIIGNIESSRSRGVCSTLRCWIPVYQKMPLTLIHVILDWSSPCPAIIREIREFPAQFPADKH